MWCCRPSGDARPIEQRLATLGYSNGGTECCEWAPRCRRDSNPPSRPGREALKEVVIAAVDQRDIHTVRSTQNLCRVEPCEAGANDQHAGHASLLRARAALAIFSPIKAI